MREAVLTLSRALTSSLRDLLPIIGVIAFFQAFVIRQPLPELTTIIVGLLFVIIGLTLFVQGLQMGLFPIGESLAHAFARKGSLSWLFLFAFALGFSTTIAEPALVAVAGEAAGVRSARGPAAVAALDGKITDDPAARSAYALTLRIIVALAVGTAIVLGVLRILKGWPLHYLIIGGYVLVMGMTGFAPAEYVGIAYDAGGVTTSTITVPLVTALGVGLAASIRGRNPVLDGFGLIAFASLMPMIFVLVYGMAA
jgi:hypothetical protein